MFLFLQYIMMYLLNKEKVRNITSKYVLLKRIAIFIS